ncbi:MAG: efflux transporter outer membrane subunit [Deltaproteobacteria bacterium]|nr:efflux transporter outer membrane subunit [Deltaproteobacteria bacterium]
MHNHASKLFTFLVIAISFAGCITVGPQYVPPDTTAPDQWMTDAQKSENYEPINAQALSSWWETFNDPILTGLVKEAVKGNLDLKEARARIREARARRARARADRFPVIDATGTATSHRSSEDTGSGERNELFTVGFDAGWELDVFGKVRRSVEAAQADLEASREDFRDVLITLVAEVALNYVEARTFQTRLTVAEANLSTQTETYSLATFRYDAGLTTRLDVEQATYTMNATRSQTPPLRSSFTEASNRLAVLLGTYPGAVEEKLSDPKPVPLAPFEIVVGVPAEVLRRRPDVRRAEREVAAQTARVGVATAEGYPSFTLPGSIGLEAFPFGDLFSLASRTFSIGPRFSWNIFDAGAVRHNIAVQDALQEQALIRYDAAILTALEDVENALTAYAQEQLRRTSLTEAAQAAQRAVDLARDQYSAGLIDFQNVLEAQRSLLSFQDQLATSEGSVTSNLIRLYKALGGGWSPEESPATVSSDEGQG